MILAELNLVIDDAVALAHNPYKVMGDFAKLRELFRRERELEIELKEANESAPARRVTKKIQPSNVAWNSFQKNRGIRDAVCDHELYEDDRPYFPVYCDKCSPA